jgi:hypothetical protein
MPKDSEPVMNPRPILCTDCEKGYPPARCHQVEPKGDPIALCHDERDYAMGFTRRDPHALDLRVPPRRIIERCKHCGQEIDRKKLEEEFTKIVIPDIAKRAKAASVFCCLTCALEDLGGIPYRPF